MSECNSNADFNQRANIFIKEEPQPVYLCHDENHIKSEAESYEDIDVGEKCLSQAKETLSSCLELENIKYENLDENSSFSLYVDQDFKPDFNNGSFFLKPHLESEMCIGKELRYEDTQLVVKKEDISSFQQDVSVTGWGFQEEKLKTHDIQANIETKFDESAKCDCCDKESDTSFDLKPDIDVLVKSEVDDNEYINKKENQLLGLSFFPTVESLEKVKCQCNENNSCVKEDNISIESQSSYLVKVNIGSKSITRYDLQSLQGDSNTSTEIDEINCDYPALLIKANLSNIIKKDEDHLTDSDQGNTLMRNNHMFGTKQDLLSESSSSVHRSHAQPHTEEQLMKNRQSYEAIFKCSECSKCFTRKSRLTQHEKQHKDLRPFRCLECSKCFTEKSALRRHEKTHKNLKPFKCSECPKFFTRISSLTEHERIHKGLKPFQCLECSKCFVRKSRLTEHERAVHKGFSLKCFQCLKCSKRFTHKHHLSEHERIHEGLKLFQCLVCSKSFTQKSTLTQHENRKYKCSGRIQI